jgi:hypothetical protein
LRESDFSDFFPGESYKDSAKDVRQNLDGSVEFVFSEFEPQGPIRCFIDNNARNKAMNMGVVQQVFVPGMKDSYSGRNTPAIPGVLDEGFKGNVNGIEKDVEKYGRMLSNEYCHFVRESEDDVEIGSG